MKATTFTVPQGIYPEVGAQVEVLAPPELREEIAETYRKAGEYVYRRDVDASLISGDAVRVDFQLDKAFAPGATDLRGQGDQIDDPDNMLGLKDEVIGHAGHVPRHDVDRRR